MRYFLVLVLVAVWGQVCYGLGPCDIAVIANSSSEDSLSVAEHYCMRRGVPRENIIAVDMPDIEELPRAIYNEEIMPAIRERLAADGFADGISCLVTVWGVPLRIGSLRINDHQRNVLEVTDRTLGRRIVELRELIRDYQRLCGTAVGALDISVLPSVSRERERAVRGLLGQASEIAGNAQVLVTSRVDIDRVGRLQKLDELNMRWWGIQGQIERLSLKIELSVSSELVKGLIEQRDRLAQRGERLAAEFNAIELGAAGASDISRRYDLLYELVGLRGVCQILLGQWLALQEGESIAAFDSELSLILWDGYVAGGWQLNDLCVHWPDGLAVEGWQPGGRTLMVSRLDGPTVQIAKGLVDRAMTAEMMILEGAACIDARGISEGANRLGSYGWYDACLVRAADVIRHGTDLRIVEDYEEALLPTGSCRNTLLYCGWYSLRRYVGSCEFDVGAVAYHVASFEAETLGRWSPDSNVWCKRLLEEGVTATLGPVHEPYLFSFPRADTFFGDLISGDYCLVECFYRSKPLNSWMMTLVGDPLYRPTYAGAVE